MSIICLSVHILESGTIKNTQTASKITTLPYVGLTVEHNNQVDDTPKAWKQTPTQDVDCSQCKSPEQSGVG